MTFLLFAVILGVLIIVHEAGHYWAARRCGVRVEEFALGFGPRLLSWKYDGTVFQLCLIPLGGYVKMAGDERTKCQKASDEFYSKSPGQRAFIALMGPVINYLFAYLCFCAVFMIGYLDIEAATKAMPARVGGTVENSPAAAAGLARGDLIVNINGTVIGGWGQMQEIISGSNGRALALKVQRASGEMALTITPKVEITKDVFGRAQPVSRIGIKPDETQTPDKAFIRKYGFFRSLGEGAVELWKVTHKTYEAFWQILSGQRSAKEGMTGLIGMFFIIKFAVGVGVAFLIHIVGVISASLAIFNLLPLIPLDGGHILLTGIEKVRGKPLSAKVDDIMTRAGFGLIILLAVYVFYVDFERIGVIDKLRHLLRF